MIWIDPEYAPFTIMPGWVTLLVSGTCLLEPCLAAVRAVLQIMGMRHGLRFIAEVGRWQVGCVYRDHCGSW